MESLSITLPLPVSCMCCTLSTVAVLYIFSCLLAAVNPQLCLRSLASRFHTTPCFAVAAGWSDQFWRADYCVSLCVCVCVCVCVIKGKHGGLCALHLEERIRGCDYREPTVTHSDTQISVTEWLSDIGKGSLHPSLLHLFLFLVFLFFPTCIIHLTPCIPRNYVYIGWLCT